MVAPAADEAQVLARLHPDQVADCGNFPVRAGEPLGHPYGHDAPRVVLVGETDALESSFNG